MPRKTRVLVLFAQEWDNLALSAPDLVREFEFIHRGFDLFKFPQNARLLSFNARAYIDRMVRLGRRLGVAAVISPHEQFGALIAAEVARRLGLPGPDTRSILVAQHKYYARRALDTVAPEANPEYGVFRYTFSRPEDVPLAYPFFVKPVKATFSVLARSIHSFDELRRHLRFKPFEQHIIKRLIRPYNDLLADYPEFEIDAHWLSAEGLVPGMQINVDGFANEGDFRIIGIVDELMYPGTMAFNRFEYPSSLPDSVRQRVEALAIQCMRAVGFDHGLFNVEMAYNPDDDSLKLVEINPRVASQFVTLYQWVDGISLYRIMLDLALGRQPAFEPTPQPHTHAGSFIFRTFDLADSYPMPTRHQLQSVRNRHPDACLMLYTKHGADLAREMKWLGSHRRAVLNLRGRDRTDLYARYRDIRDSLGFAAHAGPEPQPMWPVPTAPELEHGLSARLTSSPIRAAKR